jgi:hypothetical protein
MSVDGTKRTLRWSDCGFASNPVTRNLGGIIISEERKQA